MPKFLCELLLAVILRQLLLSVCFCFERPICLSAIFFYLTKRVNGSAYFDEIQTYLVFAAQKIGPFPDLCVV